MNAELGKLVLNTAGNIVIELSPTPEVLGWLASMANPNALTRAVGESAVQTPIQPSSADARARKRGRTATVTQLRINPNSPALVSHTAATATLPKPKQRRERRPDYRLSPREYRDTMELLLNIHEAVDYFWRLDKTSRSSQSLSITYKQLIDAWYLTTDYRAARKSSLGRVDKKQTRLNTIIRDGKGPEFLAFVRAEARIHNAEVIRV